MKKRIKWSQKDLIALRKSYKNYPIVVEKWLIKRHGSAGCHSQAYRLGLTTGIRNPGLDLRKLTIAERAYLAGFIDADGWVSFNEQNKKVNPMVGISNTHKGVLLWIQKRFTAGNLNIIHRKGQEFQQGTRTYYKRDVYQLGINGVKNVYDILMVIEPYMIIKQDKARRAIRFLRDKYSF